MEGKCRCCGKAASLRCSKCKKVFYCGKECQARDWPIHKKECGKQFKDYSDPVHVEMIPVFEVERQNADVLMDLSFEQNVCIMERRYSVGRRRYGHDSHPSLL